MKTFLRIIGTMTLLLVLVNNALDLAPYMDSPIGEVPTTYIAGLLFNVGILTAWWWDTWTALFKD